jgi:hypothetical protein
MILTILLTYVVSSSLFTINVDQAVCEVASMEEERHSSHRLCLLVSRKLCARWTFSIHQYLQ